MGRRWRRSWALVGVLVCSVLVALSGAWFTSFALGRRDVVAVLGRPLPAAPLGLLVTFWGLMYALRVGRLVLREARCEQPSRARP